LAVNVSFSGLLFDEEARTSQAKKVIKESLDYGVELIQSRSPEKTGLLKAGWEIAEQSIFNEVPYTIFQEDGTKFITARNMVKNSVPEIEEILINKLAELF
jgi:hypothetical protein